MADICSKPTNLDQLPIEQIKTKQNKNCGAAKLNHRLVNYTWQLDLEPGSDPPSNALLTHSCICLFPSDSANFQREEENIARTNSSKDAEANPPRNG